MRNRLWITILLIVLVGQWLLGVPGSLPTGSVPGWERWLLVENLAHLVVCQANQRRSVWTAFGSAAQGASRLGLATPANMPTTI